MKKLSLLLLSVFLLTALSGGEEMPQGRAPAAAWQAVPRHAPLKKVLAAPASCAELQKFFRKAYTGKAGRPLP